MQFIQDVSNGDYTLNVTMYNTKTCKKVFDLHLKLTNK